MVSSFKAFTVQVPQLALPFLLFSMMWRSLE